VRNASTVRDPAVLDLLRRWKSELRVRREVRLATSSHPHTPFTYGTLAPVIFLPRAVLERDEPGLLESVLAHELAHVRRWDDLLLKGQLVISALYFFNPIAWLAVGKMREESERACDELVLSRGRLTAKTYGQSIVTVLKLGLAWEASVAPALASRKRRLKARLETIMVKDTQRKNGVSALYPIPTALALGLILLPMAGTSSSAASGSDGVTVAQEGAGDEEQAVAMSSPMPGARVSAAWGPMRHPFTGEETHHRGIDLVGEPGAEILAAAGGTIAEATADYSGGAAHGTVVILDHGNGIKTFYSHLDRLDVTKGKRVAKGEVLGTQGETGKTTGPHLHFEVWVNGEFKDPALYVSEWQSNERE
jgi:bla regulator protein BlaR1